ncbi:hypothetical protein A2U01_0008831, partial [Trifolium medium]|nr:hypothetical protein [Trifolium medium]
FAGGMFKLQRRIICKMWRGIIYRTSKRSISLGVVVCVPFGNPGI